MKGGVQMHEKKRQKAVQIPLFPESQAAPQVYDKPRRNKAVSKKSMAYRLKDD